MKPSDSNLSAQEYIKYFVTDENTIRHINQLLFKIDSLEKELLENEVDQDRILELESELEDCYVDIDNLKELLENEVDQDRILELESELEDCYVDIDNLKERNKFLEEEVFSLEDEIRFYEDDIIYMRKVIADLEHGKY